MKRMSIFFVILVFVILPSTASGDKTGDCNLKSGGKAIYHCPNGYSVIIAGDGTDLCDGECYENGNKESLQRAIYRLVSYRIPGVSLDKNDLNKSVSKILNHSCGEVSIGHFDKLSICPGGIRK